MYKRTYLQIHVNTCKNIHKRMLKRTQMHENAHKHTQKRTQTHVKMLINNVKVHTTHANEYTRIQKYINVFKKHTISCKNA